MLRHLADIRSLLFMAITTGLLILNWSLESFLWTPFLLACFMPMTVYVMTHNHNHLPMWRSKVMNAFQDYWLTLFYGFPTFAWIPTHNENHHKFVNKAGDDTITYRISEKNNLFTLLSYPLVSSKHQMPAIFRFLKKTGRERPLRCVFYLSEIILLAAFVGTAFYWNWKKALLYIVIPHQIGLNAVLIINYIQHVHADELSEWNHSRNFVGDFANWFMMNNGYHTIHHEKPSIHWSTAKAEHDVIADKIDAELKVPLSAYLFKNYILGFFAKRFRTESMRLKRAEFAKAA